MDLNDDDDAQSSINVIGIPLRIGKGEVNKISKGLKRNEAAGPGDIAPEFIKYGPDKMYECLAELFQTCVDFLREWKVLYILAVYKKGQKTCSLISIAD